MAENQKRIGALKRGQAHLNRLGTSKCKPWNEQNIELLDEADYNNKRIALTLEEMATGQCL